MEVRFVGLPAGLPAPWSWRNGNPPHWSGGARVSDALTRSHVRRRCAGVADSLSLPNVGPVVTRVALGVLDEVHILATWRSGTQWNEDQKDPCFPIQTARHRGEGCFNVSYSDLKPPTSCFQGVTNGYLHTTYRSPNRAHRQEALAAR